MHCVEAVFKPSDHLQVSNDGKERRKHQIQLIITGITGSDRTSKLTESARMVVERTLSKTLRIKTLCRLCEAVMQRLK